MGGRGGVVRFVLKNGRLRGEGKARDRQDTIYKQAGPLESIGRSKRCPYIAVSERDTVHSHTATPQVHPRNDHGGTREK
jgi:hypothetical protein